MPSQAVQVENVVSKVKDYDVTFYTEGGEPKGSRIQSMDASR